MTNIHALPEHLPPLPDGAVYLGKGGTFKVISDSAGHRFRGFYFGGNWRDTWSGVGSQTGVRTDFHYAAPLDSHITRRVLAHRVPDGFPALPEGFVYVGMGSDMPRYENGLYLSPPVKTWEACEASAQNKHQHYAVKIESPLARKLLGLDHEPAQSGHGTKPGDTDTKSDEVANAYEVEIITRSLPPDLIIPKDAATQIEAYSFISDLARMGYRLEIDSDGIRGWRDE